MFFKNKRINYYEKILEIIYTNIGLDEIDNVNAAKIDVLKKCCDWFLMGGGAYDLYIENQYKYLCEVINKSVDEL